MRRPRPKCPLQVVVRGGVDGFPRRLPKLGTRFAFEPLLCKRPQEPFLRSQNQRRCTVRESHNFPTCTNSSRPTTMTSRLSGRTVSKKLMGIGVGSSTTWCYAILTAEFQKEVSPDSFAKIAGVNSYFAFPVKPGIFVRHVMPREPRPLQLFCKRSFWKTSAMPFGVFPFLKCSALLPLPPRASHRARARAGYETVHELIGAAVDDNQVRAMRADEFKTPSSRRNLPHTEWPSGNKRLSVL